MLRLCYAYATSVNQIRKILKGASILGTPLQLYRMYHTLPHDCFRPPDDVHAVLRGVEALALQVGVMAAEEHELADGAHEVSTPKLQIIRMATIIHCLFCFIVNIHKLVHTSHAICGGYRQPSFGQ